MIDPYKLNKGITALADGEMEDRSWIDQVRNEISSNKRTAFEYEVQKQVSLNLREILIKHPCPFKLNRKLNKILSQ